ncbi:MAG TPA: hypothetical protein VFB38_18415 [Chthonomonadaceae bacterium]|jgi:hypothetical protein|nr:hypothetical protein [Chthonomonadaceae bacterium]
MRINAVSFVPTTPQTDIQINSLAAPSDTQTQAGTTEGVSPAASLSISQAARSLAQQSGTGSAAQTAHA